MLIIRCDTVAFARRRGDSKRSAEQQAKWHRCTLCGHRTFLTPGCDALVVMAIGAAGTTVLWDADNGTLLHDCRHVRVIDDPEPKSWFKLTNISS